jgi:hypothetical protein
MPIRDGYPSFTVVGIPTDTATTDAATFDMPVPGGVGYRITKVYVHNSRVLATGATANGATATFGVFGAAAGAAPTIVANAALTGLTGSTIVLEATVAATALTPKVTADTLYFRIGTASGVAGSGIDVTCEYSVLG